MRKTQKPKPIFFVFGKSGAGKDFIVKQITNQWKVKRIPQYTTRPMRPGEINGTSYFFVDNDTFRELFAQNKIVDTRRYDTKHGTWYYGTALPDGCDKNADAYIMIGTIPSLETFRKIYGDRIVPMYITADSTVRMDRAIERETDAKRSNIDLSEICRRYLSDEEDYSEKNLEALHLKPENIIWNNDFYSSAAGVRSLLWKGKCVHQKPRAQVLTGEEYWRYFD